MTSKFIPINPNYNYFPATVDNKGQIHFQKPPKRRTESKKSKFFRIGLGDQLFRNGKEIWLVPLRGKALKLFTK